MVGPIFQRFNIVHTPHRTPRLPSIRLLVHLQRHLATRLSNPPACAIPLVVKMRFPRRRFVLGMYDLLLHLGQVLLAVVMLVVVLLLLLGSIVTVSVRRGFSGPWIVDG